MEDFSEHECEFGDADLTLWGLSYKQCLQECRAREMCTSISVKPNLRECRLHFDNTTTTVPCPSYLYSRKSDWMKKRLCDEEVRCPFQPNVKINSDCECQISECPPLDIPKNAIILGNGRLIGHSIVFACINELNVTTGYHRWNCSQPGVWSGKPVKCPDIVPPVSLPDADPVSTNEPTMATSSTPDLTTSTTTAATTTISTTPMVTTLTDKTTRTVGDPLTFQTQSTVATVNTMKPQDTKTSPTSSSKTTTSTTASRSTNPWTTTSSTTTTPPQSGPASSRTTISTTTAPTQSASIIPWTTTISPPTDQTTIIHPWFFSTYNVSCGQFDPDRCDASFDLECRLDRCQCQPPNVLDFSAETCTSACPSLAGIEEGIYGDTYQEYDYFDLRPSDTVKKNSILWPISLGSVLESAEDVMKEFVRDCTTDANCRAVHGYSTLDSLNVTTYYGTGMLDVIPTTIWTDFMRLYVRDCALRNITSTPIST